MRRHESLATARGGERDSRVWAVIVSLFLSWFVPSSYRTSRQQSTISNRILIRCDNDITLRLGNSKEILGLCKDVVALRNF